MAAPTTLQVAAIFETLYKKGLSYVGLKGTPALGTLPKMKTATGGNISFKIQYSSGPNTSRTGATALAKRNFNGYVEGAIKTRASFDAYPLSTKVIVESMDDYAIVSEVKAGADSVMKNLMRQWERDIFASAGGYIAVVSSVSTDTVTATRRNDVLNIQPGQELVSSETDGLSGSLQAGSVLVESVDPDAGTITATTNWTASIASLDAGDFLFPVGDFGLGRHGLEDWIPTSTAGLSTAYLGIDRSVSPVGLAGHRADRTGWLTSEAIQRMAAQIADFGGECDVAYMNNIKYSEMMSQAESKTVFVKTAVAPSGTGGKKLNVKWSYSGAVVQTAAGEVEIIPTWACPETRMFVGKRDKKSICVNHSGRDLVNFDDLDGNKLGRDSQEFAHDIRGYSFGDLTVETPVNWGVITVAAA